MSATARKAREAVLDRWPEAASFRVLGEKAWTIRIKERGKYFHSLEIGTGPTRAAAWIDAAKRLEGEGK